MILRSHDRISTRFGAWCWCAVVLGAHGGGKKPLFEYDDHYVMLNDYGRNEFYRRALERVVPACGPHCSVLDVGAGSGLLSMIAARLGAEHVFAIEANPALAVLAEQTVARNRPKNFPRSNVTVVAELSSKVSPDQLPLGRAADILVTETFGTMLLGEGAMNFVPDARDRLLKKGGIVVPAGGCQYATLIEIPDFAATSNIGFSSGLNLTRLEVLKDTVYWKAAVGASRTPFKRLSDRICILEIDLQRDTRKSVPSNRTFQLSATSGGTVHAVLFDWDVWADAERTDILSNAPGQRNFAGDVAWGWLLQLQEEAGADWKYGDSPRPLSVTAGDRLDMGVEFIAGGISIHARVRRAPSGEGEPTASAQDGALPPSLGSPARMRSVDRGDMVEANEFYLPIAGDKERHQFYQSALRSAVARNETGNRDVTVLDCSSVAGVPALLAAREHGLHALTLTRRKQFSRVLRDVAADNGVADLVEAYYADARDLVESMLPLGKRVDIVVVEPPGTPLHGLSPFAVLPAVRKRLLKEGGVVLPAGGCFEVGLVESFDLAQMFSVPGSAWEQVDLTVWNEEARRQRTFEKLVPYTRWFGKHSTMSLRWLVEPQCVFEVDLNEYGRQDAPPETTLVSPMPVTAAGSAHALVARWAVWADPHDRTLRLDTESDYLGRALTWPSYVQALAAPGTANGTVNPLPVHAGETWQLRVTVRQGSGKISGAAGPEFALDFRKDFNVEL